MSNTFDPYHTWLGISPAEQPPNYYRLLGVALFENSKDVISNAADRQMAHIRTFQSGKHSAESQKLLNELSAARVTLLDSKKRAAYDAQLRATMYPTGVTGVYPVNMGTQMPQQGMMPQQVSMGMAPQPVTQQSAPISLGESAGTTIKKHIKQKPKQNSTQIIIISGIVIVILLLGVALFSGKKTDEVAQNPVSETGTEESSADGGPINVDAFELEGTESENLPPRPVQENVMGEQDEEEQTEKEESGKKKFDSNYFSTSSDDDEEEEEEEEDSGKNSEETKSDEEETPSEDASNNSDDEKMAGNQDSPEKSEMESGDESTQEEASDGESTDSKAEKQTPDAEETSSSKEQNSSGISDEEIEKLGHGVELRVEPKRSTVLKFYGAKAEIGEQLTTAAEWLIEKQVKQLRQNAVFWSFDHAYGKKGPSAKKAKNVGLAKENPISATALSVAAIVGSGTELAPKDRQSILRAINFLMVNSKPAGEEQILPIEYEEARKKEASLVVEEKQLPDFHPHAWGTMAVCDYLAYAKAFPDKKETKFIEPMREFAVALVHHIERQQRYNGGFPAQEIGLTADCTLVYSRSQHEPNVVSTVWNLMALKSAEDAGIPVSNLVVKKANQYLQYKVSNSGGYKRYENIPKSEIKEIQAAIWGIQIFKNEFPEYADAVKVAKQILEEYQQSQLELNCFGTMFARDLRGETWDSWNKTVCESYLKDQCTDKIETGSWYYDGDAVNAEGGRLYCTAMTMLLLEGIYRYEPLRPLDEYQRLESPKTNGVRIINVAPPVTVQNADSDSNEKSDE